MSMCSSILRGPQFALIQAGLWLPACRICRLSGALAFAFLLPLIGKALSERL